MNTNRTKELLPAATLLLLAAPCLALLRITPAMWVASAAYGLQVLGFLQRRRSKPIHASLMGAGMLMDVVLVLVLQLQRDAVATALEFRLSPLQQAHIALSLIAVLHYLPLVLLGFSRLRNPASPPAHLIWHRRLGYSAFVFRSLGFLLMFSMLGLHNS